MGDVENLLRQEIADLRKERDRLAYVNTTLVDEMEDLRIDYQELADRYEETEDEQNRLRMVLAHLGGEKGE
jgi:predicted nuclease with TOPRIM domain